jgi:hypothetical protein
VTSLFKCVIRFTTQMDQLFDKKMHAFQIKCTELIINNRAINQ